MNRIVKSVLAASLVSLGAFAVDINWLASSESFFNYVIIGRTLDSSAIADGTLGFSGQQIEREITMFPQDPKVTEAQGRYSIGNDQNSYFYLELWMFNDDDTRTLIGASDLVSWSALNKLASQDGGGGTWVPPLSVPEPTSGLLLLVGGALLGLRRKRRVA